MMSEQLEIDFGGVTRPCARPFIKWAGGKSRILGKLLPMLPPGADLMRHVEPFMGGAAMFFARRPARATLCDVNHTLVETYLAVRDEVENVIAALEPLAAQYVLRSGAYHEIRERYNAQRDIARAERAAMFVYLNKTSFNGLHRVNRKGEFNPGEGCYKNPRILDADGLRRASAALAGCEIRSQGFEALLGSAKPDDFVYLDPPYEPVSRTSKFTRYAEAGFSRRDQERLRDVFAELDRRGCKLMLSNSDVPFIRGLYRSFRVDQIIAPRTLGGSPTSASRALEVVVRNY